MLRRALALLLLGCGDDGVPGGIPDAAPGGGGGAAPVVSRVQWTTQGCATGSPSNYTILTTAADGDTPSGQLTFHGALPGCTPPTWRSMSATQIVSCPNTSTYGGL